MFISKDIGQLNGFKKQDHMLTTRDLLQVERHTNKVKE